MKFSIWFANICHGWIMINGFCMISWVLAMFSLSYLETKPCPNLGPEGPPRGCNWTSGMKPKITGKTATYRLVQLPAAGWMRHDIGFFQWFFYDIYRFRSQVNISETGPIPNGFSTSTEYLFCFSCLVFFKLGTHFFSIGFPQKKRRMIWKQPVSVRRVARIFLHSSKAPEANRASDACFNPVKKRIVFWNIGMVKICHENVRKLYTVRLHLNWNILELYINMISKQRGHKSWPGSCFKANSHIFSNNEMGWEPHTRWGLQLEVSLHKPR